MSLLFFANLSVCIIFVISMAKKEQLPRLTGQFMQKVYENQQDSIWSDEQMLMIRRRSIEGSAVFKSNKPLQADRTHIGIVTQGSAYMAVNLRHYNIQEGSLFVVTPESVTQMLDKSADLDMQVLHLSDEILASVLKIDRLQFFRQRMNSFSILLTKAQYSYILTLFDTLWTTLHSEFVNCRIGILSSIIAFIGTVYNHDKEVKESHPEFRNMQVFNRFLTLVNEHCDEHRDLDYYAGLICLNKQYLSSIVSEVSRQPASKWIEEAVVTRIKVMLRHEDLSLNEISKIMSFPEPSNFSRYFKRVTGMTPAEYRRGN